MQIGDITGKTIILNKRKITGNVVMAKVSGDGKKWTVLYKDGKIEGCEIN
jgi:hypothetical protein